MMTTTCQFCGKDGFNLSELKEHLLNFCESFLDLEDRSDHKRLVRELDVLLNGEHAAEQASLCDIVAQVRKYSEKLSAVLSECAPPTFLDKLQDVSDRALDNMEGEDLDGFKKWEAVHVAANRLKRAIEIAEGK